MNANLVLAFRNIFRSPKRSLSLLALICAAFLAITLIKAGYADMFSNIDCEEVSQNGFTFLKTLVTVLLGGNVRFDDVATACG